MRPLYVQKDFFCLWLAKRIPRWLRYWVLVVEGADYSVRHPVIVPEMTFMDVLADRFEPR